MTNAKRDENAVAVALAESSVDGTPMPIQIDPSSGGILAET